MALREEYALFVAGPDANREVLRLHVADVDKRLIVCADGGNGFDLYLVNPAALDIFQLWVQQCGCQITL